MFTQQGLTLSSQYLGAFTDHLLSYFLGANDGTNDNSNYASVANSSPSPVGQFADIESSIANEDIVDNSVVEPTAVQQPSTTTVITTSESMLDNFIKDRAKESIDGLTSSTSASTSARSVHFEDGVDYRSPSKQVLQRQFQSSDSLISNRSGSEQSMHKVLSTSSTTSNGSTSSLLTSMASALALGEPNQVMSMQQKIQLNQLLNNQYQLNNMSPITPVNLLGIPQEMMMLPPPPRNANGNMPASWPMIGQPQQSYGQQQMKFQQQQQNLQQQQIHVQANAQQPNFLPQMNPTQNHSFMCTSFIIPPQPPQSQQQQSHQQQQQQPVEGMPFQQQIQIGLDGQTIPVTAVAGANGSIFYQVDPSVVPTSGLRYFTKAINEVSRPDDQKEIDPEIFAEKRRQRLARNRESARQSRRRKKEHLASLSAKVQKLQRQLEAEVRNKIRSMEGGLSRQRNNMLDKWSVDQEKKRPGTASDDNGSISISSVVCVDSRNQLAKVIGKTGVSCEIRRAVIAHQYHCLRQAFLSSHNHYSVWMMMQSSTFFTEASRKRELELAMTGGALSSGSESDNNKSAGSRANSKQIGKELYNEEMKHGNGGVSCQANDGVRMWPLFCYEITMTMEQEDRVINQAISQ